MSQNLDNVEKNIKTLNSDLKTQITEANELVKKFDKIRAQRLKLFKEFFDSVDEKINDIFKVNIFINNKISILQKNITREIIFQNIFEMNEKSLYLFLEFVQK